MSTLPTPSVDYHWGLSRIAIEIRFGTGAWQILELPNNVNLTARNEQEIVDGLEQHNSGYVYKPQRFTFSIDVPVNTSTYRILRETLLRRILFDLRVTEDSSQNSVIQNSETVIREYEGLSEVMGSCTFDDMTEPFRVGQLSVVTFNGKALRFNTSSIPTDPLTIGNYYGSGTYKSDIPTVDG